MLRKSASSQNIAGSGMSDPCHSDETASMGGTGGTEAPEETVGKRQEKQLGRISKKNAW